MDALPIVFDSVAAIEALPELGNWMPGNLSRLEAIRLIHVGFPLAFVRRFPSLDPIRSIIRDRLINDQQAKAADLAELHLAAFCSAIGARDIENIPPGSVPTPDFRVTWSENRCSHIEVVAGSRKVDHIERQRLGQAIAKAIHSEDRDFDIVVHCAASVTDHDIRNIVAAAKHLQVGEKRENTPNWEVRGDEITGRDAYTIFAAGQKDADPAWWGADVLSSLSFFTAIAGPGETTPRPQTRVITALPVRSYLNPVERKASGSQSKHDLFIIAFDVSQLPGAFEELKRGLPGYFQIWDHVAGVFAFQFIPYMGFTRCAWRRRFYVNTYSGTAAPRELLSLDPTDDQVYETVCCLTKSELDAFLASRPAGTS